MNKTIFEDICFDALYTKLPTELIYEIIDQVPKCNRCNLFPKTSMEKCNSCKKDVCTRCMKKCFDCNDKVCLNCGIDDYRGMFFKVYTICKICSEYPSCYVCHDNDIIDIDRCVDCFKPVCNDCGISCCSNSLSCPTCVENENNNIITMCECNSNAICNDCSYSCKYCGTRICGECKDISVAYYGKKICTSCQ